MSIKDVMVINDEMEKYLTMNNFRTMRTDPMIYATDQEYKTIIEINGSGLLHEAIQQGKLYGGNWDSIIALRIVADDVIVYEDYGTIDAERSKEIPKIKGILSKDSCEITDEMGILFWTSCCIRILFPERRVVVQTSSTYTNCPSLPYIQLEIANKVGEVVVLPKSLLFKRNLKIEMKHVGDTVRAGGPLKNVQTSISVAYSPL